MPNPVVYFSGTSIATTPSQPTNYHNPSDSDFGMSLTNAQALGSSSTIYRLEWYQNVGQAAGFANGQMWSLQQYSGPANPTASDLANEANWTANLKTNLIPKPDLVAGLGMSGDWAVFENQGPGGNGEHLVIRFDGSFSEDPTTTTITAPRDENNNLIRTPPTFNDINDAFIGALCFVSGTWIATPNGQVAVENLRVGDLVLTRDHGAQPLRWIGARKLNGAILGLNPNLRPIRIAAGALGQNLPEQDLFVSPQHRILVRSKIAQKMFGTVEILVAAKHLLQVEGIEVVEDNSGVEYYHMLFDQHEIVYSNGTESESLYIGPQALGTLSPAALEEIFTIMPELRDRDYAPEPARDFADGRRGRKLTSRHVENQMPFVMA